MRSVLLISDDRETITRLSAMVESMSLEVISATSDFEVRRNCVASQPCIVISDVEMNGGVGFEGIATSRKLVTDACVIAVTRGRHDELWQQVARACGADGYIVGPVKMAALNAAVEGCLSQLDQQDAV
jgi:DNA-binding response OmpR family regulator